MVSLEWALGQVCTLPILSDPLSKNLKKSQEVWRSLACAGSRQRPGILRTLSGRSQAIGLRWFIDLIWQRSSYSNVNRSWTNPFFHFSFFYHPKQRFGHGAPFDGYR